MIKADKRALALARSLDVAAAIAATRTTIAPLLQRFETSFEAAHRPHNTSREVRAAWREYVRAERELYNARDRAIKQTGKAVGWRATLPFSAPVTEVHGRLDLPWCARCGGVCRDLRDCYWSGQGESRADLTDSYRCTAPRPNTPYAVILHTRQPFEACERYAADVGVRITRLDYSWHSLPTVALFERAVP